MHPSTLVALLKALVDVNGGDHVAAAAAGSARQNGHELHKLRVKADCIGERRNKLGPFAFIKCMRETG